MEVQFVVCNLLLGIFFRVIGDIFIYLYVVTIHV